MALCDICDTEMTVSPSCVASPIELYDGPHDRITYGHERPYGRAAAKRGPCGDCGVHAGGFHHLGCDLEQCPLCGRQLISCGCPGDEDDDLDE
jgi:hypothetical protein